MVVFGWGGDVVRPPPRIGEVQFHLTPTWMAFHLPIPLDLTGFPPWFRAHNSMRGLAWVRQPADPAASAIRCRFWRGLSGRGAGCSAPPFSSLDGVLSDQAETVLIMVQYPVMKAGVCGISR